MLSIRFDHDHEWWAPGVVVERLFVSAVEHGRLAPELEEWRHIADANGGFSLAGEDPFVAHSLTVGLLEEARAEIERMAGSTVEVHELTYRASLEKLVALLTTTLDAAPRWRSSSEEGGD